MPRTMLLSVWPLPFAKQYPFSDTELLWFILEVGAGSTSKFYNRLSDTCEPKNLHNQKWNILSHQPLHWHLYFALLYCFEKNELRRMLTSNDISTPTLTWEDGITSLRLHALVGLLSIKNARLLEQFNPCHPPVYSCWYKGHLVTLLVWNSNTLWDQTADCFSTNCSSGIEEFLNYKLGCVLCVIGSAVHVFRKWWNVCKVSSLAHRSSP